MLAGHETREPSLLGARARMTRRHLDGFEWRLPNTERIRISAFSQLRMRAILRQIKRETRQIKPVTCLKQKLSLSLGSIARRRIQYKLVQRFLGSNHINTGSLVLRSPRRRQVYAVCASLMHCGRLEGQPQARSRQSPSFETALRASSG